MMDGNGTEEEDRRRESKISSLQLCWDGKLPLVSLRIFGRMTKGRLSLSGASGVEFVSFAMAVPPPSLAVWHQLLILSLGLLPHGCRLVVLRTLYTLSCASGFPVGAVRA